MKRAAPLLLIFLVALNVEALTLNEIQGDVMCTCGCGKVLENCDCGTAEMMREEIRGMMEKGMTKDEIIKELQSMYGKEVLINPPKEGVFTGLWYYPVVVIVIGMAVIYMVLRKRNAEWYGDPDEMINEDDLELEH